MGSYCRLVFSARFSKMPQQGKRETECHIPGLIHCNLKGISIISVHHSTAQTIYAYLQMAWKIFWSIYYLVNYRYLLKAGFDQLLIHKADTVKIHFLGLPPSYNCIFQCSCPCNVLNKHTQQRINSKGFSFSYILVPQQLLNSSVTSGYNDSYKDIFTCPSFKFFSFFGFQE